MPSAEMLHSQLHNYLILGEQLKAQYADIDDETLRDTLEGISDLPQPQETNLLGTLPERT